MHCNDLPSEILIEIFLHHLADGLRMPQPRVDSGPLLLIQVCGLWRRVGLGTSQLWNSFSLVTSSDATCLRPDLELVQLWLSRSGVQPLSFGIHNSQRNIDPTPALRLFGAHSQRWKAVNLLTERPPAWDDIGVCEAPLLERLLLAWNGRDLRDVDQSDVPIASTDIPITSTDRLSELVWEVDRHTSTFNIEWSQLTALRLSGLLDDVLHVLTNCPLLEACDLSMDMHDDSLDLPPVPHPPILLEHLKILTLDAMRYAAPVAFVLDCLAAPNLSELRVGLYFEFEWPHAEFAAFVARSRCAIKTLGLLAVWVDKDDLVEVLRLLTALETLEIANLRLSEPVERICVADIHLELLTHREGAAADTLCPRLRHLVLDRCFDLTDGVLARMMMSRWRLPPESPLTRLHSIEIMFPDDMVGHDADRMCAEELWTEGLDVSFKIPLQGLEENPTLHMRLLEHSTARHRWFRGRW
ncbi:hypothetical protein B0H11DRAFT_1981080 [Mycena galericulata]|nr:hypothetical protein B0H11DRAFT_1981080 [Mycena galericulata]